MKQVLEYTDSYELSDHEESDHLFSHKFLLLLLINLKVGLSSLRLNCSCSDFRNSVVTSDQKWKDYEVIYYRIEGGNLMGT